VIIVNLERPIYRVGVVSDTHIPSRGRFLPPALFQKLSDVDLILHAGDLVEESVLDELTLLAPVEAVAGNMDPPALQERLGHRKLIQIGPVSVGLVHGDGIKGTTPGRALEAFLAWKPDLVVFGHSHYPIYEDREGILLFNPGSPVDPRRAPAPSCGLLTVTGGSIRGEILYFS
jgi:uncharacterized protein